MEDGRPLPRRSSRLRLLDETRSMPGALTSAPSQDGSVASTTSRLSRMSVADSLRALRERHKQEDETRQLQREMEDLRLRLSRAEEHSRVLEAALGAQGEDDHDGARREHVKPEEHNDARREHVKRFLQEDLSTRRYHGYDEHNETHNGLLARTMLGAVPTY